MIVVVGGKFFFGWREGDRDGFEAEALKRYGLGCNR